MCKLLQKIKEFFHPPGVCGICNKKCEGHGLPDTEYANKITFWNNRQLTQSEVDELYNNGRT